MKLLAHALLTATALLGVSAFATEFQSPTGNIICGSNGSAFHVILLREPIPSPSSHAHLIASKIGVSSFMLMKQERQT